MTEENPEKKVSPSNSNGTKPTIYLATDHSAYELKNRLLAYVRDVLGYEVEDCGNYEFVETDDYPDFVSRAAAAISEDPLNRKAIILGASGQGEAMLANRFKGVRAAVYYGKPGSTQVDASGDELGMIASTRVHNNANVLSIGGRFVNFDEAREAVTRWLETEFPGEERHQRRNEKIDSLTS